MKIPQIFNNKFIAIVAGIIALSYFISEPSLMIILLGVAWFVGAIFTWKKQIWAAGLLTSLAIYSLLFHVILHIPNLKVKANNNESLVFDVAASYTLALGIIVISVQSILLLCVVFYGIIVATENRKKAR